MHLTRLGNARDAAYAAVYLASRESEFLTGINLQLDGGSSIGRAAEPRLIGAETMQTHPRVSLSMLSQWNWTVDEDLEYFDREGVEVIGVSLAKMQDGGGWEKFVPRIRDGGYRVANLIGLGPFQLARPRSAWTRAARSGARRARRGRGRAAPSASCSRPAPRVSCRGKTRPTPAPRRSDPLLDDAAARGLAIAFEHTNGLRVDIGFLHTLRDAIDFARGARRRRVHGDQRVLGRARPRPTRSATASTRSRSCS